jgi:hypothetical protein
MVKDKPEIVKDPEAWTPKQLSSIRRDCLSIAVQASKDNTITLAAEMYEYVLNGKVPTNGGWK